MIFRLYPNLLSLFRELEIPLLKLLKLLTIVLFGGVIAIVESLQVLDFVLVINMVSSSFIAKSFKAFTCVLLIFFVGTITIIENLYAPKFLLLLVGFPLLKPFASSGFKQGGEGSFVRRFLTTKKARWTCMNK